MIHGLDASAMLAFLLDEGGAEEVENILDEPGSECITHAWNLCEVFYAAHRVGGETHAQQEVQKLLDLGVVVRSDMDFDFWQSAGRLKSELRRLSLADCGCLALATRVGGEVLTSDHHEFDAVVPRNLCPIRFIR